MATLSNYIKLTKSQYQTLISQGYIIVNETRYDYDANAIYLVEGSDDSYVDLTSSQTITGEKTFESIRVGNSSSGTGFLNLWDESNGSYASISSEGNAFQFSNSDGDYVTLDVYADKIITSAGYNLNFPQDSGTFALTKNYYDKTTSDGMFIHKYSSGVTTSSTLTDLYNIIGTDPSYVKVGDYWYFVRMNLDTTNYYEFEIEAVNYPGYGDTISYGKGRWTGAYVNGSTILSNLLISNTSVANVHYYPYATENYVNTNFIKVINDDADGKTLSQLVSIVGLNKPTAFKYRGSYYFGSIKEEGSSTYKFEFEDVNTSQRYKSGNSAVAGTTSLSTIFNSEGDYYKPYELESYVELSGTSGTLTSVELEKVQRPNAIIKWNNSFYTKYLEQGSYIYFKDEDIPIEIGSGKWAISNTSIRITKSTGEWTRNNSSITSYTADGADNRYVRYDTNAQGLTDTQKSNARTNIGAGTSSFSGDYNDLINKPTIPTVNNATLTITQNSTSVGTFTANASSNVTANIVTPKVYRYI